MITILVCGRNDGYGINLHKRTAISLNALAALCREPEDEILYVDCNTPAHDLTLVEAIADTLTPEARRRLRTFRVTGEQMRSAIGETPLVFSDELSRNVGLRRANPANRWVLSTNCDILIHPLGTSNFQEILAGLAPQFYLCPRVGIPAAQWQALDRMSVRQITDFCDAALRQGIRYPVEKAEPWLRFASVGDFQLAPREQWLEVRGCEEGMKHWGHSDANNARRLNLLNGGGRTPDLAHRLGVLHLDHNVSVAASHEKVMVHNDWNYWVAEVTSPLSRNPDNWGLAGVEVPEIRLEAGTELDPAVLLKSRPRQRNLLAGLRTRLITRLWRSVSRVANWVEKR